MSQGLNYARSLRPNSCKRVACWMRPQSKLNWSHWEQEAGHAGGFYLRSAKEKSHYE